LTGRHAFSDEPQIFQIHHYANCSSPPFVADLEENKMALHIAGQLSVAEANVRAIASGRTPPKTYKAKTGNLMMAVTLGSRAGVIFAPPVGSLRSTWLNWKVKAETMLVPKYRKQLGLSD
jgi:hypothetical protein